MLTELAISSLTDILLASLTFFLAGRSFQNDVAAYSPRWYWAVTLTFIGLAAMLGAIDHGFFEPIHHPMRWWVVTATRCTIVVGSFFMLITTALQFWPQRVQTPAIAAGAIAGLALIIFIMRSDNFLWIMAYYGAMLLVLLGSCLFNLRRWPGAWWMIAGILVALTASVLAAIGFGSGSGLGIYGTYHVVLLLSAVFLYLGGRSMRPAMAA